MTHLPKESLKINLSITKHMKGNMHLNIISGMKKKQCIGRNLQQWMHMLEKEKNHNSGV
jgi:hypothetical protein